MASDTLNLKTKELLVESIKKLMKTKPLDKISVSEVAKHCGVSRRAFYYHFGDIYEAIGWACEKDFKYLINQDTKDEPYSEKARRFLNYLIDNHSMFTGIQNSSQSWRIKNMYFRITGDYIFEILKNDPYAENLKEHDLKILADCYSMSVAAVISSCAANEIDALSEFLIELIEKSLIDSYRCVLKAMSDIKT